MPARQALLALCTRPANGSPALTRIGRMPPADALYPISLNTAAVLTGRSTRTWQRRIEEGQVPRLGDGRGALVPFSAVRPALVVDLTEEDVQMLVRADQGDAAAQADVGALFALAALDEAQAQAGSRPAPLARGAGTQVVPALHFLTQAAQQGQADAMHWLGLLHAAGLGEPGDDNALALMWIAKAAAHGHVIAAQQLAGLLPGDAAQLR